MDNTSARDLTKIIDTPEKLKESSSELKIVDIQHLANGPSNEGAK